MLTAADEREWPEPTFRRPQGLIDWQAARLARALERQEAEKAAAEAWKKGQPERRRLSNTANGAKRRAAEMRRVPPWADLEAIRAVYAEARRISKATGIRHHVDHEIPLQGKLVSGLHVHTNLQVLVGDDNISKSNRFEVE